jgi:hypothetical protein
MEILEHTPNRLVCGNPPNNTSKSIPCCLFGCLLVWGFPFLIIPLLMIPITLITSGVEELTCKRVEPTQVNCELTRSTFMGLVKGRVTSLSKVREARVDTQVNTTTDSEGNTSQETSYKIVLLTQNHETPLSNNNLDDASRINEFIKNNNSIDLMIKSDRRWMTLGIIPFLLVFLVMGSGSILVGFYIIMNYLGTETYIFDKTIGKLTQQKQSWRGNKVTKVKEYPLREIIDVRVEEITDSDGDFMGYKISLVLKGDNSVIFLLLFIQRNEPSAQEFANTIAQFLNLPKTK